MQVAVGALRSEPLFDVVTSEVALDFTKKEAGLPLLVVGFFPLLFARLAVDLKDDVYELSTTHDEA